jgi:hypothetical protein
MDPQDFLELCKKGDLTTIREVLDDGFEISVFFEDIDNQINPLCYAKNGLVVDLLFEYDELGELFNYEDDVPVIHHVINAVANGEIDLSALMQVAENDDSLNRDWDGNCGDFTIHAAVRTGIYDIVKVILDAGSSTNILSNDGCSAIGIAAQQGNKEIVQLLLEYGSPKKADQFRFMIEFDNEDDVPEVEDPIKLAANDEIRNILMIV